MRSPLSLPSSLAGASRRRARNTLSRIRARSLKAIKWLQLCSPYRSTARNAAAPPAHTNAAIIGTCVSKPNSSSTAYPPKIVMELAHRWPASPIRTASTIKPVSGFTSPTRRPMTTIPLRFFTKLHRLSRSYTAPATAGHSKGTRRRCSSTAEPCVSRFPPRCHSP